jgi:tetratricopeptide (TPR) repeat protein
MENKINQIKSLVNQKKHKKALEIIRKITQKKSKINYEILELEATCLFSEKNYKLANLKMEQALTFANNNTERFNALSNLAAGYEKLNEPQKAISCLKNALDIDGTLNAAPSRYWLVQLANSIQDFDTVEKYASLLINVSEYASSVLLLLGQTAINTNKHDDALKYLSLIATQIRTDIGFKIDQQGILSVLNGFHLLNAFNKEHQLLSFLEPKFEHEQWFTKVKDRLTNTEDFKQEDISTENSKLVSNNPSNTSFLKVTGNTQSVIKAITKLISKLESMGAKFHPGLCIVENDGDITVKCMNNSECFEQFMEVPIKCMPLVNDYHFSLDDDGKFLVKSKKKMLNKNAKIIMELLANMYNECNKLANWKMDFPLFSLAGHEVIFNKLIESKSDGEVYRKNYFSNFKDIKNEVIIKSFIGSRVLRFSSANLRKVGVNTKNKFESGFIPILELMNHKIGGNKFEFDKKELSIETYVSKGVLGREVFVQYNLDDPVITLLTYGFVDTLAKWIYSVPVELKTKTGLTITVSTLIETIKKDNIPNHLQGVAEYLPAHIERNGKTVNVSKLIIPGVEHSHVLKVVLTYLLKKIDLEGIYSSPKNLEIELEFIENQLIEFNLMYWLEFDGLIKKTTRNNNSNSAVEHLVILSQFYIKHINDYISKTGNIVKSN